MAKWDFEKSEKRMNKDMKKRNKAATKRRKPMGCAIVWSFLLIGLFAGLGVAVAIIVGILTDSPTINIEDYQIKNISTVFYDRDGKEITSGKIKTGYRAVISEVIYEISVSGDITGEGNVKSNDVSALMSYFINKSDLGGVYLKSADFNNDRKIDNKDLVGIARKAEK